MKTGRARCGERVVRYVGRVEEKEESESLEDIFLIYIYIYIELESSNEVKRSAYESLAQNHTW